MNQGEVVLSPMVGVKSSLYVLDQLDDSGIVTPFNSNADDSHDRSSSFSSSYHLKLASNSAALTTFLLLNTMIGSGILNQPFVFLTSGIFGGLVAFLFAAVATWHGLILLTEAGVYANVLEYSGLAKFAFAG